MNESFNKGASLIISVKEVLSIRAQFATEYLMVVAFGLLVLVPTIYYFYSNTITETQDLQNSLLFDLGNRIVNEAESLYLQGPPAKTTLEVRFPPGLSNITILGNHEMVMNLSDDQGVITFFSDVPLGDVKSGVDLSHMRYNNVSGDNCTSICFTQGPKQIELVAFNESVRMAIE